ncbi:MAG TPA: transglutaminase domain-containing protein [Thermoanaerobaculia bacterium]|nr:transglutaminase domain-containing protein [Thermoanaerobaculia bacterium]
MRKLLPILSLALIPFLNASAADLRKADLIYTATIEEIPPGLPELTVWIPLPHSSPHQAVSNLRVESPFAWKRGVDAQYGNDYLYTTIENPPETISVSLRFDVERRYVLFDRLVSGDVRQEDLRRNLRPDRLVTISPRIRAIAEREARGKEDVVDQARAMYDYVLGTMQYDKKTPGWGRGDSERACDVKAGNCTDFHSLFISLARARSIPARFIIGFPLVADRRQKTSAYHCWAEFFVEEKGWVPVDISEASKTRDPAVHNFLFGNLDYDRVAFTVGRDLVLDPPTAEPLNYFIYPHAESGGKVVGKPEISLEYAPPEPAAEARKR